jgi:hypothetical protein
MRIPHFAGAPNQLIDEIITSIPFSEISTKIGYTVNFEQLESGIEFYRV